MKTIVYFCTAFLKPADFGHYGGTTHHDVIICV